MTEQIQWDADAGQGGVYLNKNELADMGPQITRIVAFERMQSWDTPDVLHVAFENPPGWTKLTKPMQGALKKMFPGKSPNEIIGATVMIMAQYTPAKGGFSEGYQIAISAPPGQRQGVPQPPTNQMMPQVAAIPPKPAQPKQQEEIAF